MNRFPGNRENSDYDKQKTLLGNSAKQYFITVWLCDDVSVLKFLQVIKKQFVLPPEQGYFCLRGNMTTTIKY